MSDETTKPDYPDFSHYPVLVDMGFEHKVLERQEFKAMLVDLETKVDELNKEIEAMLIVAEVKKVSWNGIPVYQTNGRSASKIDARLLAQKGVDADIIKACTIPGTAYTYIRVDDPSTKKSKKEQAREIQEASSGDAS